MFRGKAKKENKKNNYYLKILNKNVFYVRFFLLEAKISYCMTLNRKMVESDLHVSLGEKITKGLEESQKECSINSIRGNGGLM